MVSEKFPNVLGIVQLISTIWRAVTLSFTCTLCKSYHIVTILLRLQDLDIHVLQKFNICTKYTERCRKGKLKKKKIETVI